jgi:hypothetical protein
MRRIVIPAVAALSLLLSGCLLRTTRHGPHGRTSHTVLWIPGLGVATFVGHGHRCTHHCNHYWHNNCWYTVKKNHVHRPGCGHGWNGHRWVRVAHVQPYTHHRCDKHCGHYWHGHTCYHMAGHVHGPGCGHAWRQGRWVMIIR